MANFPSNPQRSDPIRDQYYKSLEFMDKLSDLLFWVATVLSFAALFIDENTHTLWSKSIQIIFIIIAVTLFIIGQSVKLYFWPRSESPRRLDFLSYGLGVDLTHVRTGHYYNNKEIDPIRRTGAAILENTLFTAAIVGKMLHFVRVFTLLYFLGWIAALAIRDTSLGLITVAAQVLFSEQIISRWLRMEWLRSKCETFHNVLSSLFRSSPSPEALQPHVWAVFAEYECAKTNAGILMSNKIFEKINPALSQEWEQIKKSANIL